MERMFRSDRFNPPAKAPKKAPALLLFQETDPGSRSVAERCRVHPVSLLHYVTYLLTRLCHLFWSIPGEYSRVGRCGPEDDDDVGFLWKKDKHRAHATIFLVPYRHKGFFTLDANSSEHCSPAGSV